MTAFFEVLAQASQVWVQYPLHFAIACLVGALIGYFLSRIRHQGTIQAQKERLEHKDDVIKFKDEAIAASSTTKPPIGAFLEPAPAPQPAMPPPAAVTVPPPAAAPSPQDPRFRTINAQIISETESAIRQALKGGLFDFVFNPKSGQNKVLSFKDNGEIGNGRNHNEHTWRIAGGRLEILNDRGQLYSRFFFLPDRNAFHHTNDPDTQSIKGQYMTRLKFQPFVPAR